LFPVIEKNIPVPKPSEVGVPGGIAFKCKDGKAPKLGLVIFLSASIGGLNVSSTRS
jgi:hypothetical protein